jgi:hypothetical protein
MQVNPTAAVEGVFTREGLNVNMAEDVANAKRYLETLLEYEEAERARLLAENAVNAMRAKLDELRKSLAVGVGRNKPLRVFPLGEQNVVISWHGNDAGNRIDVSVVQSEGISKQP